MKLFITPSKQKHLKTNAIQMNHLNCLKL